MNRKPSRGITGYIILLATLLLVAILLNGGLNQTVNRRIEYPELLTKIKAGTVGRVAIRNNSLAYIPIRLSLQMIFRRKATILKRLSGKISWKLPAR